MSAAVIALSTVRADWIVPASLAVGTAAAVLGLLAAVLSYAMWRTSPSATHGWWTSAALFGCVQLLAAPRSAVVDRADLQPGPALLSVADLVVALVILALVVAGTRARRSPDPLLLGLTLGVAGWTGRVVMTGVAPFAASTATSTVLAALVTVVHVAVLVVLLRHCAAQGWTTGWALAAFLVLASTNLSQAAVSYGSWVDGLAAAVQLAGTAFLLKTALDSLRDQLLYRQQATADLRDRLEEAQADGRDDKERLHEIRSTVAGISHAFRLLHDEAVPAATRRRLDDTLDQEMQRLERLLDRRPPQNPEPVDLDATIDPLLELHRARGRRITWHPTGQVVRGRRDDIAEVLNILLDNAATHAAGAESRIDVTRDEEGVAILVTDTGPGIPPEVRDGLFEWGVRGHSSRGQGIGLNVGRRLLLAQNGSLTLAGHHDRDATVRASSGTTWVIRLPAARKGD